MKKAAARIGNVVRTIADQWRKSARLAGNARSCVRLCADFILARLLTVLPQRMRNRRRRITTRTGITLCYRLNKGDLQGIREVWLDEVYRLPCPEPAGVVLDLGANIGLTSLWLARRYPVTRIIAVEPDPANAALVRENLSANGINAEVVEAAVGPKDGIAGFAFSSASNLGHVSSEGSPVTMVSVESLMERFQLTRLDLVKVDIEGGEQELFLGPGDWLERVQSMIVEFHPDDVDYPRLTGFLEQRGFRYYPAGTAFPQSMDAFWRPPERSAATEAGLSGTAASAGPNRSGR